MKIYARTTEKSYLNNFQGEDWQEVTECFRYFPSGKRLCYKFASGFIVKKERCESCYVFEK